MQGVRGSGKSSARNLRLRRRRPRRRMGASGSTRKVGRKVAIAKRRSTRKKHRVVENGTKVSVKAFFENHSWTGKVVGRQGPPTHEVFRLLIEPEHGGASVWRRPSELTVLS